MQLLHTTFITPFDRDEIHRLISRMDDVLDLIQDTAESLVLYDIQKVTPEATQLAELVLRCSERVQSAVGLMASMADAPAILKICQEIDKLESEADKVMRGAISRAVPQRNRHAPAHQAQGGLRTARVGHGQVPGRGQRDRKRRSRKRLIWRLRHSSMDLGTVSLTLILLVLLALAFDFMNGFHDAANSIATVVSTGVLKPWQAVLWAAFFNVVAVFFFHLSVAATVGKGIVDPAFVDNQLIFGALIGAIAWNLITWYYGIPSELFSRAHRRHDRRRAREGRHRAAARARHHQDRRLHLRLADARA